MIDPDIRREHMTWQERLAEQRKPPERSWPQPDDGTNKRLKQIADPANWELLPVYDTTCCRDHLPPECPPGYCCHQMTYNLTPTRWPAGEHWFVKNLKEWT